MKNSEWDKRIARAEELIREYPFAAELLNFYGQVAAFQREVYEHAASESARFTRDSRALREHLDFALVVRHLPALLSLAEKHGAPGLVQTARELAQKTRDQWIDMLLAYARDEQCATPAEFFARACVQPYAEYLARTSDIQLRGYTGPLCPLCNGRPQAAVLRPEGDGAKRSLICSFCLLEWNFRRIVCPGCSEQDNQKLPRFSAPEFPHVRVEACDSCQQYLKAVDLTVNGLADPIVDEIAAAPLDLWASEHGYTKIQLNLLNS